MADLLRLLCVDAAAPPVFWKRTGAARRGYEPDVAALVAERAGRPLAWEVRRWPELVPALLAGEADAILCGQAITTERRRQVAFTRPYAIFDEAVLVRAGSGIAGPDDLRGRRVGALARSTNMALAETFAGAETVAFDGTAEDVLGVMVEAVRSGAIDALVDDDVALLPALDDPALALAFSVPTRNAWALAVDPRRPDVLAALDAALGALLDGALAAAWRRWLPDLTWPLGAAAAAT